MSDETQTSDGGGPGALGQGTPPPLRLDDRYEVTDRTGLSMGVLPIATLQTMLRQGRLFPTDRVSKNGAAPVPFAELPEFSATLDESLPPEFQVAGSFMRPRPEMAGLLDATTLAGVFARICQGERTGRLYLAGTNRRTEKVIIFQRGVPVNAMSSIASEQLGNMLIGHGLITDEVFSKAVDVRRDQGGRLGSALIKLDAMTPRQLHRALSLQAMERLQNAFRQREGAFCFVPDDTAANEEILLFASTRELIETGLHAALSAQEISAEMSAYGDAPLVGRPEALQTPWGRQLQQGDAEVLTVLGAGMPVHVAAVEVGRALRLTLDEARLRLLALLRYGLIAVAEPQSRSLEAAVAQLQSQHYYDALGLGRGATAAEIQAAVQARSVALGAAAVATDTPANARLRERIRQILDAAARTLLDEDERPMYDRALQLGLDFEQPEARQRLQHEHFTGRGKALLAQQRFDEAKRAFNRAAEAMPDEPMTYVHGGWAAFLSSSRDANAAAAAVREVERALRIQGDLDAAHMTIGKIQRLAGVLDLAEKHLRHAIALNPHNNEAQSELRLIFTRELDGKVPGGKKAVALDGGIAPTLIVYGLVFVALFVMANVMESTVTEWPEFVLPKDNHLLKIPREIPLEKRVFGVLEYYYLLDDTMWWSRRIGLLVVGLLATFVLLRKTDNNRNTPLQLVGTQPVWIAAAVPYGMLVGFMSPTNQTGHGLGTTLGMTALHVAAEQIFFVWFLTRSLLRQFTEKWLAVGAVAAAFGLYHLTYFAIYSEPTRWMMLDVCQIGVFAGGAYAALHLMSGGIAAPLVAHLLVNGLMMLRTYLAYHT